MANRSKHRHQPYDLNNPLNWTVAKLKNEIEKLGMKLTTSVSESALLRIYNQVSGNRTVASAADLNLPEEAPIRASEQSQDTVNGPQNGGASDLTVPVESQVRASERSQETVSRSENGGANIINNALAVISGVQGTVLALQATDNKILQDKQSSPSSSTNMLAKVYQNQGDGTSSQTVPVQHQRDWTSSQLYQCNNMELQQTSYHISILCRIRYVSRLQRVNMLTWLVC